MLDNATSFVEMVGKSSSSNINVAGGWTNMVTREISSKTNKIPTAIDNADQAEIIADIAEIMLIDPISWVQKLFGAAKEQYYDLDHVNGKEGFVKKRQRLFIEESLREQEIGKSGIPQKEMEFSK